MKLRYAAPALGLLLIAAYAFLAPPAPPPELDSGAVRGMVRYLETAPAGVAQELARHAEARAAEPAAPVAAVSQAAPSAPDATESGLGRVADIERRIAGHYPATEAGALIRRYVALSIADVDTDFRPDLSQVRAMNDLMQDAAGAAADLEQSFRALPAGDAALEAERAALLQLAAHLGTNEAALPAVESLLGSEIGRRAGLELVANEARLNQLVDSYTRLVADPRRQADFVRRGIEAQDDERLRQGLQGRLDSLVNHDLTSL